MEYNVKKLFGENTFYLANRIQVESLEDGAVQYGGATLIDGKIYSNQKFLRVLFPYLCMHKLLSQRRWFRG